MTSRLGQCTIGRSPHNFVRCDLGITMPARHRAGCSMVRCNCICAQADPGLTWKGFCRARLLSEPPSATGAQCWPRLFERRSNLDASVAIYEEARCYWLERPHEAAVMNACLDVDVIVGGFEKRQLNFVPGVARTSPIGLRLGELSHDVGRRPLHPGESFLGQQLAQLCFCHFASQSSD